jgi:hypothetical protein
MIEELLRDSADRLALVESGSYASGQLSAADIREAVQLITGTPTHRSFHLLMALRRDAPDVAATVAPEVQAAVLAEALAHQRFLNDFGYLDPGGSCDGPAGRALRATGSAALPVLAPVLVDLGPAPLLGSEEATLSHLYGYRRCDFAYRYAMLALGEEPPFQSDPVRRDQDLRTLRDRLAAAGQDR